MIGGSLGRRPVILAIAGPNGAGKTTFFYSQFREAKLHFVNADDIANDLALPAYEAAEIAGAIRRELVQQRQSFAFETVFSDPVGAKLAFLQDAAAADYNVVLCFIGISSAEASENRVAIRVSKGGHDVPTDKLIARFPRTMANLKAATKGLPLVVIYDNEDLAAPFKRIAEFRDGKASAVAEVIPLWAAPLLRG